MLVVHGQTALVVERDGIVNGKETIDLVEKIEKLQGSVIALELILARVILTIPPRIRARVTSDLEPFPEDMVRRYGLDSKPAFKHGVEDTFESISRMMRHG